MIRHKKCSYLECKNRGTTSFVEKETQNIFVSSLKQKDHLTLPFMLHEAIDYCKQ